MLFNSIEFVLFLPIVFVLYWFVTHKNLKLQNALIVIASYIFYGWWDWRFLSLIIFSTLVDYSIGYSLSLTNKKSYRKALLRMSLLINLGFLGVFKYYNFFLESLYDFIPMLKTSLGFNTLQIILPVGISFYTFQTLSYTIDVYKRKLEPTKDFVAFAAFVSFFPQLVAGPIERATNLLPQVLKRRRFSSSQSIEGVRLILWGLFKKIVIADALAPSVDEIFSNFEIYPSSILILGAIFFAFQIYCDFSGYSDIARGVAKLLGIELMVNFNFPYFSRSIGEFWRKWHISLSTWFRDYLYIPLGGSRVSRYKGIRNVFAIFLISGFWHGANWTFIAWGAIHALLFIPSFLWKTNRKYVEDLEKRKYIIPSFYNFWLIVKTFIIVTVAWIFFRAKSIEYAYDYIVHILQFNWESITFFNPYDNQPLFKEYLYLIGLIIVEYLIVTKTINLFSKNLKKGILVDSTLLVLIIINAPVSSSLSFIYFQF
ncbi:MBOAT family O-acyltransferase [Pseudotenacibaculum sp. MALMAid0570]|uniref:MBOAT family O-acyltransferase n=1 Tax=Pseudotenacibaculum sp. MALMAid0570 TaxID=3143938 RepID=UPI0032DE54F6